MKKALMLAAAFVVMGAPAAFADHHEDGKDGKHHKGEMFEKKDVNGDGVISKDEFLKAHEEKFNDIDMDKSGDLTKEELKEAMAKWHEKRKGRMEKMKEKREESAPADE